MASAFVAKQLIKYLGDFVEDAPRVFDPSGISLGPFSGGEIEFTNVALRSDALASLDLPVDVAFGKIGRLKVNFSVKRLELIVQDVVAVIRPRTDPASFDEAKEREALEAVKKKAIAALDKKIKAAQAAAKVKAGDEKQGWGEYFAMGAANYFQIPITIERVHIRVEHAGDRDFPSHFGLGIRLELLELRSPDDAADRAANLRERAGIDAPASLVKTLRIEGLCVYVDSKSVSAAADQSGATFDDDAVARLGTSSDSTQYVLAPLKMEVLVVYNNNAGKKTLVPQMDIALSLEPSLKLAVGQWYLKRIILLANAVSSYKAYAKYQRFRPHALLEDDAPPLALLLAPRGGRNVAASDAASASAPPLTTKAKKTLAALWTYALAAVKTEAVPALRKRLTVRVGTVLILRSSYLDLYSYKLDPKWHATNYLKESAKQHAKDEEKLEALEAQFTIKEITAFRAQAERLLATRKDAELRMKESAEAHAAQLKKERSERSWGEWWSGTALPSESGGGTGGAASGGGTPRDSAAAVEVEADAKASAELRAIYDEARSKEFKPSWETQGGETISMMLHVDQGCTRRDQVGALNLELFLVKDERAPARHLSAGATKISADARGVLFENSLTLRRFYRHPVSGALTWAAPAPGPTMLTAQLLGISTNVTMRSKFMDVALALEDLRIAHNEGSAEFGTLPDFAMILSKGTDGSHESSATLAHMPAISMHLGMPPCPSKYAENGGVRAVKSDSLGQVEIDPALIPDMYIKLDTSPLHVAAVVPHLLQLSTFFDLGLGDKIDLRSLEDMRAEQWQKMRANFMSAAATTSAPSAPEMRIKIGGISASVPEDAGVDATATMVKICLGSLAVITDSDPTPTDAASALVVAQPGDALIQNMPAWSNCYDVMELAKQKSDNMEIKLTLMQAVVGPAGVVGGIIFSEDVSPTALPLQLIHPIDLTVTMMKYSKAQDGIPASRIICSLKTIRMQTGMKMLRMLLTMKKNVMDAVAAASGGDSSDEAAAAPTSSLAVLEDGPEPEGAAALAAAAAAASAEEVEWEEQVWDESWSLGNMCSEKLYRWQVHDRELKVVEHDSSSGGAVPEGRIEAMVMMRLEVDFEGVELIVGDVGAELVAIRIAALKLLMEQRFCDMDLHARLGALCIEDLHRPRTREALGFAPQCRLYLLNSHPGETAFWADPHAAIVGGRVDSLISVDFHSIKPLHGAYANAVADMEVDARFERLTLEVNRDTVVALQRLGDELSDAQGSGTGSAVVPVEEEGGEEDADSAGAAATEVKTETHPLIDLKHPLLTSMRVNASLGTLELLLNVEDDRRIDSVFTPAPFARAVIAGLDLEMTQRVSSMRIKAKIQTIELHDLTPAGRFYPIVIGVGKPSEAYHARSVESQLLAYSASGSADAPPLIDVDISMFSSAKGTPVFERYQCDMALHTAKIEGLRFVFCNRFIEELQLYPAGPLKVYADEKKRNAGVVAGAALAGSATSTSTTSGSALTGDDDAAALTPVVVANAPKLPFMLNCRLISPCIVIPLNSESPQYICLEVDEISAQSGNGGNPLVSDGLQQLLPQWLEQLELGDIEAPMREEPSPFVHLEALAQATKASDADGEDNDSVGTFNTMGTLDSDAFSDADSGEDGPSDDFDTCSDDGDEVEEEGVYLPKVLVRGELSAAAAPASALKPKPKPKRARRTRLPVLDSYSASHLSLTTLVVELRKIHMFTYSCSRGDFEASMLPRANSLIGATLNARLEMPIEGAMEIEVDSKHHSEDGDAELTGMMAEGINLLVSRHQLAWLQTLPKENLKEKASFLRALPVVEAAAVVAVPGARRRRRVGEVLDTSAADAAAVAVGARSSASSFATTTMMTATASQGATKVAPLPSPSDCGVDALLPEPRSARDGAASVFDLLPGVNPVTAGMKTLTMSLDLKPIDLRLFLFSGSGGTMYDPERNDIALDERNRIISANAGGVEAQKALASLLITGVQVKYAAWTATLPGTDEALSAMEVDARIASIKITDTRHAYDPADPYVFAVTGDANHGSGLSALYSTTPRRFDNGVVGSAMAVDAGLHNLRLSSNNVVMALAGFAAPDPRFAAAGPLVGESASDESDATEAKIAESSSSLSSEEDAEVPAPLAAEDDQVETKVSSTSVRLRMTQPMVVMMGDWENTETETLNLTFDLDLAYFDSGFGSSAAKVEVHELRGFRHTLDTSVPAVMDGDFIQPFSLNLAFNSVDREAPSSGEGNLTLCHQNVALFSNTNGLALRAGSSDFKLLMSGINALTDKSSDGSEATPKPKLDVAGAAASKEQDAAAVAASTDADAGETKSDPPPSKLTVMVVDFSLPILQLTAVNDEVGAAVLQLRVRNVTAQVEMDGVADTMEAAVYLVTDADYFNDKLNVWESLIEPWPLSLTYKTLSAPWILRDPSSADRSRSSGRYVNFDRKLRRADQAVTILAEEMLELNVSSAFCQSLSSVMATVNELQAGLSKDKSSAGVVCAKGDGETSFNITMFNCTGRQIEFSAAGAGEALARSDRLRMPFRHFKTFVGEGESKRHSAELTNGRDELSAQAQYNAVEVQLNEAIFLEMGAPVAVASIAIAAGDASHGRGAPKLIEVYLASAGGGDDDGAATFEAKPHASFQYGLEAVREDPLFRTSQMFDLKLERAVQALKIIVVSAWEEDASAVQVRQIALYSSALVAEVQAMMSPTLDAAASTGESMWQRVGDGEVTKLPVAANVDAYGATDLPIQQALQRSVFVRAGSIVERGSLFHSDAEAESDGRTSWLPSEINVDSKYGKVVDLARCACQVQVMHLFGREFSHGVKVHIGLVGVDGNTTSQTQTANSKPVYNDAAQMLVWKNQRFTFDLAALSAGQLEASHTGAVPSLSLQIAVPGLLGNTVQASIAVPLDDLLASSADENQAFKIGHAGTIVLKAKRVEGTLQADSFTATGENEHLVCQVTKKGGKKQLLIRSRLALQNSLPVPIEVEFTNALCENTVPIDVARNSLGNAEVIKDLERTPSADAMPDANEIVEAGDEFFVPLDELSIDDDGSGGKRCSWVRFRPVGEDDAPYAFTRWFQTRHLLHRVHFVDAGTAYRFGASQSIPSVCAGVEHTGARDEFSCFIAAKSGGSQSLLTSIQFLSPIIVENVLPTRVQIDFVSFGPETIGGGAEEKHKATTVGANDKRVALRSSSVVLEPGQRARVHNISEGVVSIAVQLLDLGLHALVGAEGAPTFELKPRRIEDWSKMSNASKLFTAACVKRDEQSSEIRVFVQLTSGLGLGCGTWLQVYCPYLIVNASGHTLRFRAIDTRPGRMLKGMQRTAHKPVPSCDLPRIELPSVATARDAAAASRESFAAVEGSAHLFAVEPDFAEEDIISFLQVQFAGSKGAAAASPASPLDDFVMIEGANLPEDAAPWSPDIGIGAKQIVTVQSGGFRLLELYVNSEAGPGLFASTSLITVRPEQTIVNGTDALIYIGQQRDPNPSEDAPVDTSTCIVGDAVPIASHGQIGWEWPDRRHGGSSSSGRSDGTRCQMRRSVRIKLADVPEEDGAERGSEKHWLWSDPVVFDVGTTTLKMYRRGTSQRAAEDYDSELRMRYISVETVPHPQGGTRTIIRALDPQCMEYRIVNRCAAYSLHFRQVGVPVEHDQRLLPLSETSFAWDHEKSEREKAVWMHVQRMDIVSNDDLSSAKMMVCSSTSNDIQITLNDAKGVDDPELEQRFTIFDARPPVKVESSTTAAVGGLGAINIGGVLDFGGDGKRMLQRMVSKKSIRIGKIGGDNRTRKTLHWWCTLEGGQYVLTVSDLLLPMRRSLMDARQIKHARDVHLKQHREWLEREAAKLRELLAASLTVSGGGELSPSSGGGSAGRFLRVTLVAARDLKGADITGADPFFKFKLILPNGTVIERQSTHKSKSVHPTWHDPSDDAHTGEDYDFDIPSDVDIAKVNLEVTGFDKDDLFESVFKKIARKTTDLGETVINLGRLARRNVVIDEWFNLVIPTSHARPALVGANDSAEFGQIRLQFVLVPEGFEKAKVSMLAQTEVAHPWWHACLADREHTIAMVDAILASSSDDVSSAGDIIDDAASAAAAKDVAVAICDVPTHRRLLIAEFGSIEGIVPPQGAKSSGKKGKKSKGGGGGVGTGRMRSVAGMKGPVGPGDGTIEPSSIYLVVEYGEAMQTSFEERIELDASGVNSPSSARRDDIVVDVPPGESIGVTLTPIVKKRGALQQPLMQVVVKAVRAGGFSEAAGVQVGCVVKSIENRGAASAPMLVRTMKDVRIALRANRGNIGRVVFEPLRVDEDELWAVQNFNQALEFKHTKSSKMRVQLFVRDSAGELLNELSGVKDRRTTEAVEKLLFLFGEVNKIDRMAMASSSGKKSKSDVLLGSAIIEEVPNPNADPASEEWEARVMLLDPSSTKYSASVRVKLRWAAVPTPLNEHVTLGAHVHLGGIGLTIIDSNHRGSGVATRCAGQLAREQPVYREMLNSRRELLRIALEGADVHYSVYQRGYAMECSIDLEWLQIDNALIGMTRQPVVLSPSPIDLAQRATAQDLTLADGAPRYLVRSKEEPTLALKVLKQKGNARIDNYDLVRVKLRELTVDLETSLLLELLRFAQDAFTEKGGEEGDSGSEEQAQVRGGGAAATKQSPRSPRPDNRFVVMDADTATEELVSLSERLWPQDDIYFSAVDEADADADAAEADVVQLEAEMQSPEVMASKTSSRDEASAQPTTLGSPSREGEKERELSSEQESEFEGDKLFYFKALDIERIVIHLTVRTNPNTDLDSVISADNLAMRPIKIMVGWLLKTLGNIDDATLQFNEFLVFNLRDKQSVVQAVVQDFYVTQAKHQVVSLLGSVLPLGNPVSMFSDVGKGAITILWNPASGIMEGDFASVKSLGTGVAQMAYGVTHFTARAIDKAGGFVDAIVDEIAGDADDDIETMKYVEVDADYDEGFGGLFSGVGADVSGMAIDLGTGVTDVVMSGVGGVTNVATGKLGGAADAGKKAVTSTVKTVGILSAGLHLTANVLDAIGNMAKGSYEHTHRRAPRLFDMDGVLTQYSKNEAQGQSLALRHRLFKSGEMYIFHRALSSNKQIDALDQELKRADKELYGMVFMLTTTSIHCFNNAACVWGGGLPLAGLLCQIEVEALVDHRASAAIGGGRRSSTGVAAAALPPPGRIAQDGNGSGGVDWELAHNVIPDGALIALVAESGCLVAQAQRRGNSLSVDAVQPSEETRFRVVWENAEGSWWIALQNVGTGHYLRSHRHTVECCASEDVGRWQQFAVGVVSDDSPTDGMGISQRILPGMPADDAYNAIVLKSRQDACLVGTENRTKLRCVATRVASNCVFRVVVQDEFVLRMNDLKYFSLITRSVSGVDKTRAAAAAAAAAESDEASVTTPCDDIDVGMKYRWYFKDGDAGADSGGGSWLPSGNDESEFEETCLGIPITYAQPTGLIRLKAVGHTDWKYVDLGDRTAVQLLRTSLYSLSSFSPPPPPL